MMFQRFKILSSRWFGPTRDPYPFLYLVRSATGGAPVIVEAKRTTATIRSIYMERSRGLLFMRSNLFRRCSINLRGAPDGPRMSGATTWLLPENSGPKTLNVSGGQSDASSYLLQPKHHLGFHPQVTFDSTITVTAITLNDWSMANKYLECRFPLARPPGR